METQRMILRNWHYDDDVDLFQIASDPEVALGAGWKPHESLHETQALLKHIVNIPGNYAVIDKKTGHVIGAIVLMRRQQGHVTLGVNEGEVGYWLARSYWSQGLMSEMLQAFITYCFQTVGLEALWCGHLDDNVASRRVQEKCGFVYHHDVTQVFPELVPPVQVVHMSLLKNTMNDERCGE